MYNYDLVVYYYNGQCHSKTKEGIRYKFIAILMWFLALIDSKNYSLELYRHNIKRDEYSFIYSFERPIHKGDRK